MYFSVLNFYNKEERQLKVFRVQVICSSSPGTVIKEKIKYPVDNGRTKLTRSMNPQEDFSHLVLRF